VPFLPARPGHLRTLRIVGVGALGLAVGIGATLAVSGLRGGGDPVASVQRLDLPATPAAPAPPAGAEAEAEPVAAGTARAAVERFLEATARGDFDGAYRLLDEPSRRRYPSAARWTRAQADRPVVTGVRVGAARRAGPTRPPSTRSPGWSRPARSRCGGPAPRAAAGGWPPTPSRSGPTCRATGAPPTR
jgi:hypothetical protein